MKPGSCWEIAFIQECKERMKTLRSEGKGTMEGGSVVYLTEEGQSSPVPICPLVLSELWSEDKEQPWHTTVSAPYPSCSLVLLRQLAKQTLFQIWTEAAGAQSYRSHVWLTRGKQSCLWLAVALPKWHKPRGSSTNRFCLHSLSEVHWKEKKVYPMRKTSPKLHTSPTITLKVSSSTKTKVLTHAPKVNTE